MDFLKRFVTRQLLGFVIRQILKAISPYLLPILGVVLLLLFLEDLLFDVPSQYEQKQGQMAYFTTGTNTGWDLEKDKVLDQKYHDLVEQGLGSKEAQLYTPSQYEQASGYKLMWSILAALDRVLGDPVMNDGVHIEPNPEARYALLKPTFTWRDGTVKVTKEVVDDKGKKHTETQTQTVKLLQSAVTFAASYQFFYTNETSDVNGVHVEHEVLNHVERHEYSEQENHLVQILKLHHLPESDKLLIEELARNYSGDTRTTQKPPIDGGVPLPSEEIKNDIKQALKMRGLPDDWLTGMEILVMSESTGNPKCWNPTPVWYSSEYGYQHAAGLCQMMPPTFEAHKMAGHDDIWNPLDNLLASLDYIQQSYGSVYNIPGVSGGDYIGY